MNNGKELVTFYNTEMDMDSIFEFHQDASFFNDFTVPLTFDSFVMDPITDKISTSLNSSTFIPEITPQTEHTISFSPNNGQTNDKSVNAVNFPVIKEKNLIQNMIPIHQVSNKAEYGNAVTQTLPLHDNKLSGHNVDWRTSNAPNKRSSKVDELMSAIEITKKRTISPPATDEDEEEMSAKKRKLDREFDCSFCGKKFLQATHLKVHIRSHIGYKPFQCKYCQKRFTQSGNLKTHEQLHSGLKPHKCSICNKSFSKKGNLTAHQNIHKRLRPFICKLDNCYKKFTQLGNMKAHQNKFHSDVLKELTSRFKVLSTSQRQELSEEDRQLLEYFLSLYKFPKQNNRILTEEAPDIQYKLMSSDMSRTSQ